MALGPVMLDLEGAEMTAVERERLRHPLVGGVILFTRNYRDPEQLERLVQEIHGLREPQLLVAVDHEGGRVQRFQAGFTRLPPAGHFGALYDENRGRAKRLAEACGWLMATELRAVGVDFSFAPVLDVSHGISAIIGDRAFHANPEAVAQLAHAYMIGMTRAGMAATGKHFPGHGGVAADSHIAIPVDEREYKALYREDLVPFMRLIRLGLAAVMPAHVIYPRVDAQPAGFSRIWLQDILRKRLRFSGIIFSDDLSMEGATVAGDPLARAHAALDAGCDMILVCNNPKYADAVLEGLGTYDNPVSHLRLVRMHGRGGGNRRLLAADESYQQAVRLVTGVA